MFRFVLAGLAACAVLSAGELPAFPGAEGFGANTPGGRGGKVLLVTTLADSGPGSLRAACEAEGARVVVFRVSGIIELGRPIEITHPYITIAAQTAPGEGVCLRGYNLETRTHDVIVRYLRSRPGDISGQPVDALDIGHDSSNVIFDHCSANWSVDECLSLSGRVANVTVQWCLIGESLNRSVHPKGAHGYGSLSRADGPVSWHHNLWIHNDARNPRLGDNYGEGNPLFDVRNNVIYDYGGTCSGLTQGNLKVNYVANYVRSGPSSRARAPISVGSPSQMEFYLDGNLVEDHPEWSGRQLFTSMEGVSLVPQPFAAPRVHLLAAARAFRAVLLAVGATVPARDAVDARLVEEVRTRGGKIINSQREVGGWPVYPQAEAPADSDQDGMPDDWERAHGLDPHDPSDAGKPGEGGYTNIENYINGIGRK